MIIAGHDREPGLTAEYAVAPLFNFKPSRQSTRRARKVVKEKVPLVRSLQHVLAAADDLATAAVGRQG